MPQIEMRALLKTWQQEGIVQEIGQELDPIHQVAAALRTVRGREPMLLKKIKGYSMPMVSGLGGSRALMAKSMGIVEDELIVKLMNSIIHPISPTKVDAAPVQEHVIYPPFDIKQLFPICKYHEQDAGQFLVSGILVVKDAAGQKQYTSIRRMQYYEGNKMGILISSPLLYQQYLDYEARGEAMEVAVMFGVVPAVVLSSQISTHLFNADKLSVAGALLGSSLPVVKAKTVDIDVLAHAEVVLEGRILPFERKLEGPFGELGGYYGDATMQPVVEITAVTHRSNPLWQTIYPSGHEEHLPMALAREAFLLHTVRAVVPSLLKVYVTAGGIGRYHAVLQIRKQSEGDGKQALLAAFASDKDLKHVVVVDEDVNIFDPYDVEWAIATRVQADLDVFIVSGAKGSPLEPSHQLRGVSAKMGIDATYPMAHKQAFKRTSVPIDFVLK